jgi:hypothetical protein
LIFSGNFLGPELAFNVIGICFCAGCVSFKAMGVNHVTTSHAAAARLRSAAAAEEN